MGDLGDSTANQEIHELPKRTIPHIKLILLLILIFVSSTVLLQAGTFKNLEVPENAERTIDRTIQQQINEQAGLSLQEKQRLFIEEKSRLRSTGQFDEKIRTEIKKIKDVFRTADGIPYPYGNDGIFFMRMARNIVDHGHPGDTWKQGSPYLSYNAAPRGRAVPSTWYPRIIAVFHKILGQSLEHTVYLLPIIFGVGSVLLLFLLGETLFSLWMGFYSALLFSFHPFFVTWNHAGFADTNAINLFLSLVIVYSFVNLLESENKIFWGGLTFTFIIIFFNIWNGAFYILFIICAMGALRALIAYKKNLKSVGIIICMTLFFFAFGFAMYGDLVKERLFPSIHSVESSIVELQPVTIQELIVGLGGALGFILSIAALMLVIHGVLKKKEYTFWILLIWFIVPFTAGIFSQRFLFYASPPLALMLGYLWYKTSHQGIRIMKKKRILTSYAPLLITLLLIACIPLLFWESVGYLQQKTPFITDATLSAMDYIKQSTNKNAIIATWWDYGYSYQYYAERGTLVDPGFTPPQQVKQIASAFLTTNESYARNILQMLNCGVDFSTDNITLCSNPPQALIVVNERMIANVNVMQQISEFKDPIKMSKIKRCTHSAAEIVCKNGFTVKQGDAKQKNTFPKRFYDYTKNKTLIKEYDTDNDFSFVLFDVGERLYSFTISNSYVDSMLARFIARDTFDYFTLLHTTEFPEQILIYDMKWNSSIE